MSKTYIALQDFDEGKPLYIPLQLVDSSQVKAIGYDAQNRVLAVTFVRGTGAIYQYPNVEQATFEAFRASESAGTFFGQHIKSLPFKKFAAELVAA